MSSVKNSGSPIDTSQEDRSAQLAVAVGKTANPCTHQVQTVNISATNHHTLMPNLFSEQSGPKVNVSDLKVGLTLAEAHFSCYPWQYATNSQKVLAVA